MDNNKKIFKLFRPVLLLMGLLLLLHLVLRIIFRIHNHQLFPAPTLKNLWLVFIWGLKMDLASLALLNLPVFILLFIVQYEVPKSKTITRIAFILFSILNTAGLAINIIDIGYFPFSKHRSNADLLYVFADSAGSFASLLKNYWLLLILFIASVWALFFLSKKIFLLKTTVGRWQAVLLSQLILTVLFLLVIRGWEARPLIPASPLLQVDARELPIAQNSINCFLYSLVRKKDQLKPGEYFSQDELNKIISSSHSCCASSENADSMIKKNVVVCILESFSRVFLTPGNIHKAQTPFFDSLIKKSIFFPNAFSNGFESNQGIVAILGGLPSFLDEPFYYSDYANTPLRSMGNILKEKGYDTNFFMGAGEDHFGFGKFCRIAGIDNYYSRKDFNDDRFYDGNWGIFDEPFLQFGAQVLSKKNQPFFAVFFNLSSHPPFAIPEKYQRQFNSAKQSPQQRSISYVDYSFRQFFEACKKSTWFQNSIFVFCADHYLFPDDGSRYTLADASMIPIFIYDPSKETGETDSTLISQVDITPSLLDLLHYHGKYSGFGTDIFDNSAKEHYAINKSGYIYQIMTTGFILGYDLSAEKSKYLYHYSSDSLWKNNLIGDAAYFDVQKKMEQLLKANIQCYTEALLRRSLE